MSQLFGPRANTIGRIVLASILVLPVAALALHVLLMNSPYVTGQTNTPEQPVPFSHKHHVTEDGIDCRYCHFDVEKSAVAGVPPTQVCMSCHAHLWTNAAMLEPVRASYATGVPLRWRQANRLPGYVYFDHSIHIAKGIGCTTCHGPVGQMPLIYQARKLSMGWCISCHRDPGRFVRKPSQIFAAEWSPDDDPAQIRRLLSQYLISTKHLTDCSTCHR
ncbi:MAG TPA: cytochrome c3 family protein [Rhizomicrobium sp.]|nr:cytochrome c3 family protein [Rhizomicrobium sp.]